VQHVFRDENTVVNDLVQQASSLRTNQGKIGFLEKSDVPVCIVRQSVLLNQIQQNRIVRFLKLEGPEFPGLSDETNRTMTAGPANWRTPLVHYLENSGHISDRKVQRQAFKYVMLDNTLYRLNAWDQINLR
jgi:hypothetical protein